MDIAMRPRVIMLAERLYWLSIAAMSVVALLTWPDTSAQIGTPLTVAMNAGIIGVSALLLVLAVRRRSRVALWLLIALTVLGAVGYVWQVASGILAVGAVGVATTVQTVLAFVAAVLLLLPAARRWFARPAFVLGDVA
ncbi:MAG TPA: hypothetical protein VFQ57_02805 [Sphingomonas sp.]|nr:hypothetical protein [Sphingomonas sp.]